MHAHRPISLASVLNLAWRASSEISALLFIKAWRTFAHLVHTQTDTRASCSHSCTSTRGKSARRRMWAPLCTVETPRRGFRMLGRLGTVVVLRTRTRLIGHLCRRSNSTERTQMNAHTPGVHVRVVESQQGWQGVKTDATQRRVLTYCEEVIPSKTMPQPTKSHASMTMPASPHSDQ